MWHNSNVFAIVQFDSVGVEKLIGILGFSLFGSLSLLPFTVDRVKDDSNITETHKIILVLIFGLIWVLASVGILCGLHGKSDFEQAVCRFTARLGILGLTLLVILNLIHAPEQHLCHCLLLHLHDRRCHTSHSVMDNGK